MQTIQLFTAAFSAQLLAKPPLADMVDDCTQVADAHLQLRGCSEMIASDQYSGQDLSRVLGNRGIAPTRTGGSESFPRRSATTAKR